RRAVGARVFVAISGQSIRGWIADRAAIGRFREHDAEPAREGVDRLHLERRLPGEVDAEEGAAVGLGHPARLGDPTDVQVATRVECEAHGTEESLAPEWEARTLVLAVHALDAGSHDRPAEHQLGEEELAGERAELAAGMVERDAVDRVRPTVGNP